MAIDASGIATEGEIELAKSKGFIVVTDASRSGRITFKKGNLRIWKRIDCGGHIWQSCLIIDGYQYHYFTYNKLEKALRRWKKKKNGIN